MARTILILFLDLFFCTFILAEPAQRFLVELRTSGSDCFESWWMDEGLGETSYLIKALPVDNWWVVEMPADRQQAMKALPCVLRVMEDRRIEWRLTPNDPAYINQKDMNLIGMPRAWDITTGGVTADGDTIVVAVIDDGFQIDHEDILPNVWYNHHEIPGDGIDNDGNGYIDDYVGINIGQQNDQHPVRSHGTSVCGIIGAKGNNGIGVSGVNWNIKLMLISGAIFESQLIESYQYVYDMRRKYRQTQGASGAFVVATNLSAGVNGALAEDHPLWCGMYDKLGEEGILSFCAAPNNPISVDVNGDMPTTCTSPYMIAVTNVDLSDAIVGNAGFGAISIDIGAPGHGTITAASGNQYKEFPGTSAATPHATGTVALMYSTPCASFLYDVRSNPSGTAARIRDVLFATGAVNNSLKDITVTGRRLQADAALRATIEGCDMSRPSAVHILSVQPNPVRLADTRVYFEVTGDTMTAFFEMFTLDGRRLWELAIGPPDYDNGYVDMDTRSLAGGVYLITLRNKKDKVTRKLFVF